MGSYPTINAIYISPLKAKPMVEVDFVEAIKGHGLKGDRYCIGKGHYSNVEGWGAQVTLIQAEAIDAVNQGYADDFTPAMLRRNLVTSGVDLNSLIGKTFICGSAVLRGTKKFPPCMHLARLLRRQEVLQYFSYCCGIGAEVIQSGLIQTGDRIELSKDEPG